MQWRQDFWCKPPFNDLAHLALQQMPDWPDCDHLNRLGALSVRFIEQAKVDESLGYYEEIIYQHRLVPTREYSWHDLFNACIWLSFPQSKALLNQQHMQDIQQYGTNPRTPRRNRITHFDECGVVLAYTNSDVPQRLQQHDWQYGFVDQRPQWGRQIQVMVFGHANYEMLLNPYIGLTGKYIPIEVSEDYWRADLKHRYGILDAALAKLIEDDCFAKKGLMSPLPLLGVPGWYAANEQASFYQNQDYFMPKNRD